MVETNIKKVIWVQAPKILQKLRLNLYFLFEAFC